ncbi:MAG: hypothetical protein PF450_16950 [Bacteroidales bacterium]|jgi:transaldolase|nr:hypothetical protein [Bacteroidales bacterium]
MKHNKYLQWLSSETESVYWHDSAIEDEQVQAFMNGAAGMTTNPFLVNATLKSDRKFWDKDLEKIPGNLKGDEKVEALMACVTGHFARKTMPIYQEGIAGKGYVCAQTNPNKIGEAEYMFDQAKRLASWSPNMVIKLPATKAGIEAYEECTAIGLNVAATLSFTVPQVLAVGEARERGKKKALVHGIKPGLSIAVLMVGRLDDYLRDVSNDSKSIATEQDISNAGTACIKRAYSLFNQRGYDTFLMPAGCRGAHHIIDLAGARMLMSIAPKIALLLENVSSFEERIDIPVAEDSINRLLNMPDFRKSYEPDGMKAEEFITFGSVNRTTTQFINEGWNPLEAFKY